MLWFWKSLCEIYDGASATPDIQKQTQLYKVQKITNIDHYAIFSYVYYLWVWPIWVLTCFKLWPTWGEHPNHWSRWFWEEACEKSAPTEVLYNLAVFQFHKIRETSFVQVQYNSFWLCVKIKLSFRKHYLLQHDFAWGWSVAEGEDISILEQAYKNNKKKKRLKHFLKGKYWNNLTYLFKVFLIEYKRS